MRNVYGTYQNVNRTCDTFFVKVSGTDPNMFGNVTSPQPHPTHPNPTWWSGEGGVGNVGLGAVGWGIGGGWG